MRVPISQSQKSDVAHTASSSFLENLLIRAHDVDEGLWEYKGQRLQLVAEPSTPLEKHLMPNEKACCTSCLVSSSHCTLLQAVKTYSSRTTTVSGCTGMCPSVCVLHVCIQCVCSFLTFQTVPR